MPEITAIAGNLGEQSSTALNPVGATWTKYDTTGGIEGRYIYLQADGDKSKGDVGVCPNGKECKTVDSDTLHLMPVMAIIAVTDDYYAWFQTEGYFGNARSCISSSLGSNIDTNYKLGMYVGTNFLVPASSLVGGILKGHVFAYTVHPYQDTSYTCETQAVILLGERGQPKLDYPDGLQETGLEQALTDASATQTYPLGYEYTEFDPAYGRKKYVYLQLDEAQGMAQYGVGVISVTGTEAQTPAAHTLSQMPVMAMATLVDDEYGWFQMEGYTPGGRLYLNTGIKTTVASGDWLALSAGTQLMLGHSGQGSRFIGMIECRTSMLYQAYFDSQDSYSASTVHVYLRGEKGMNAPSD